jgi:serine/threonine-protein phosphatase 2A activator
VPEDIETFKESIAYHNLTSFIQAVNQSLPITKVSPDPSSGIKSLLSLLSSILLHIENTPPLESTKSQRFGNLAFRALLDSFPQPHTKDDSVATKCCAFYWKRSWGDHTRLDYGSGHELNFLVYLLCNSLLPSYKRSLANWRA